MKQRLWLAAIGFTAGAILAYLHTRESASVRQSSVSITKSIADAAAARLGTPPVVQPRGAVGTTPSTWTRQPAATVLMPEAFAPPYAPPARAVLPRMLSEDTPFFDKPLLQDEGGLWSGSFASKLKVTDGGGGVLDFMHQKVEEKTLPMIEVSGTASGTADVGVGYRLIKNEDTMLLGRLGGGFSRDYACLPEGQDIPELLCGVQLEHQLSSRSKVLGTVEYAHDVTEFGHYRLCRQAAWEVLLDPDKNVSLRTGVLESTNASPTGERAKNLDYNLDVIWKF